MMMMMMMSKTLSTLLSNFGGKTCKFERALKAERVRELTRCLSPTLVVVVVVVVMVFGRLWGCGGGGPTSGGPCHKILIIPRDLFVCSSHLLHHHHLLLLLLHSSSRENFPASHGETTQDSHPYACRLAISRKSLRGQRLVEASDNPDSRKSNSSSYLQQQGPTQLSAFSQIPQA
ncbi:hypothetical protein CY35_07G115100 [Sphagnum magellanicum]|uniref:Uncharacterized protein n=1 Tax=Sphagnum magellanicum TaxID=128215 RepID=A0ACB8HQG9_9BRYO|nr:hypothetical protein CY35_07G115100 [Sphagnum magellanicum]